MTATALPQIRFSLRPYQEEAIAKTIDAANLGMRRQLGVAATGTGKTTIFCALAQRLGARTLILAHRDELVAQAAARVREIWPGVNVGIVKAGDDDVHAHVVVASVQTLARTRRLERLLAPFRDDTVLLGRADPFDLVVVDEAHHAAADSYRTILDGLYCGQPDGPLLLGVTATPDRGDGKGLDDVFDDIVWSYDILWGIRSGYLADLRGLRVTLDALDLSDVKVSRGDYEAGSAGRALADADAPSAIVNAWREHAADRRTLVFTPTVDLARLVADTYRLAGVAAEYVHGGTPLDERRAMLRRYHQGDTQVLANCAVLTEGFDEPATDCVVVARPTRSRALYTQMVGRGTRIHPDKADCLVLDVAGASDELSLVTVPSLFGIGDEYAARMGDATGTVTEQIDIQEQAELAAGRIHAEQIELFRKVRAEGIAWVPISGPAEPRRYHRTLGQGRPTVVLLERPTDDNPDSCWLAGLIMPDGRKRVLEQNVSMEMAQGVAEDFVRQHSPGGLVRSDAGWRSRDPSPKQRAYARHCGITIQKGWTAGDLSDAIDAHKARQQLRADAVTRARKAGS